MMGKQHCLRVARPVYSFGLILPILPRNCGIRWALPTAVRQDAIWCSPVKFFTLLKKASQIEENL
jgi:hypothetical protein